MESDTPENACRDAAAEMESALGEEAPGSDTLRAFEITVDTRLSDQDAAMVHDAVLGPILGMAPHDPERKPRLALALLRLDSLGCPAWGRGDIHTEEDAREILAHAGEPGPPNKPEGDPPAPGKFVWVCDECGGTDVRVSVWMNPNTEEVTGGCDEGRGGNWCEACEDNVCLDQKEVAE
jgi:hypothetical protein